MHRSRINGILIDCNTDDIQARGAILGGGARPPIDRTIPAPAAIT